MRFSLSSSLLLILLAGPAFAAEVSLKPPSPEARAAVRDRVLRAVDAKPAGSLDGLWAHSVTCGPRLWAAIKQELGADADVLPSFLLIETGMASRAGLQPVDAAKAPAEQKQNLIWLTENGAKLGQVVVENGVFRGSSTAKLGELVAARFLKEGKKAVRDLDAAELPYFRQLLPFHVNPLAVSVASGERTLLMDFDSDLKAVWIEWAPVAAGAK